MTVTHPVRPAAAPPVGPADVRAARELLAGVVAPTPMAKLAGAERAVRRSGAAEVREPATHRVVQDPRCVHADRPARRAAAGPRASSPPAPATTRRAWRSPRRCSASGPRCSCRCRRRCPRSRATRGYGATVHLVGDDDRREPRGGVRVRRAHRRGARAPVRPRRRDRRPGHRRAGDPRAVPGRGDGAGPDRRRRPARAASAGGAAGPDVRVVGRAGRGGGGVAAVAGAHAPTGRLPVMRTLADGIAVGSAGRRDVPAGQPRSSTRSSPSDEDALSRALLHCLERAKLVVEPAGAAAVAALLEHPRRFATPVVAVLSGGNIDPLVLVRRDPARHGRRRALRRAARPDRRPAGRARGAARR